MSWQTDLLAAWGAPATPQNLSFLNAWSQAEGANSYNNPLNVTSANPYWGGSTGAFNTFGPGLHVLEFPSESAGIAATTKWLSNGYTDVIAAFKSGNPNAYFASNPAAASDFKDAWSYGVGGVQKLEGGGAPSPAPSSTPDQGFNPLTTLAGPLGIFMPGGKPSPAQLAESTPSWLSALLVPFSEWWKAHPIALLLVALFVGAIALAVIASDHTDAIEGAAKAGAVAA